MSLSLILLLSCTEMTQKVGKQVCFSEAQLGTYVVKKTSDRFDEWVCKNSTCKDQQITLTEILLCHAKVKGRYTSPSPTKSSYANSWYIQLRRVGDYKFIYFVSGSDYDGAGMFYDTSESGVKLYYVEDHEDLTDEDIEKGNFKLDGDYIHLVKIR